jgi:hypothetical protein
VYGVAIALAALLGTTLQFMLAMQQMVAQERDAAQTFRVVDDWRREVSWRRPLRWARQRAEIRRVLAGSPAEATLYMRVRRTLLAWFLLVAASAGAVVHQLRAL